jgi:hypothetical protein
MSRADSLLAEDILVSSEPDALYRLSMAEGWGDGLPLVAPTEEMVRQILAATTRAYDEPVCHLPPTGTLAIVETVAINAAMAGCEPAAFPFVLTALEALSAPDFNAASILTTTHSTAPLILINGPSRDALQVDYGMGCLGAAGGRGSMTIGRAVTLSIRNIGGQRVGLNAKSTYGQPGWFGTCFGEWEEESPWPSLAEERGFAVEDDVVTVYAGAGTVPLTNTSSGDGRELLYGVAKSISYPLNAKFMVGGADTDVFMAIPPTWARRIAAVFKDLESVKQYLQESAWQPIDAWPTKHREDFERAGRINERGRIYLCDEPKQFVPLVCGGMGGLHACYFPNYAVSVSQTRRCS